jgi:hypothetical protein
MTVLVRASSNLPERLVQNWFEKVMAVWVEGPLDRADGLLNSGYKLLLSRHK